MTTADVLDSQIDEAIGSRWGVDDDLSDPIPDVLVVATGDTEEDYLLADETVVDEGLREEPLLTEPPPVIPLAIYLQMEAKWFREHSEHAATAVAA